MSIKGVGGCKYGRQGVSKVLKYLSKRPAVRDYASQVKVSVVHDDEKVFHMER